jgi:dTDP-glucose 4,6-dehydratase/UDP-glucose 4-epimerase
VPPQRFLVTGGAGFLGAELCRRLLRLGRSVRVLDNGFRSSKRRLEDLVDDIDFVDGDIRDLQVVTDACKGVDCVVHLAAINGTENFYAYPDLVLDVGVRGLLNVIEACRHAGVVDLAVASSSEVYQTPPIVPTNEEVPLVVPNVLNPRYSYAGSKIISELLAINFGRKQFERVVVFRPHNVYGPDMSWEHVIPQFIVRSIDLIQQHPTGHIPFPIQGDGRQTRAFTYIDDFVDGLLLVIDQGRHLNVYNIGNPEEVTIEEVARRLFRHFGREAQLLPGELPPGSTQRRCPDVSKLRALGYAPSIPLAVGLTRTVEWYSTHMHLRPNKE